MKFFYAFFFLFSLFFGQSFLINSQDSLGIWALDQSQKEAYDFRMDDFPFSEALVFYKKNEQWFFGNLAEKVATKIKLKENKLEILADQKYVFGFEKEGKDIKKLLAPNGAIYLNQSLEDYFFEKIAGQYEDTLFFTKDGKTNFFGYYTDYRLIEHDAQGFDGNGIVFYRAENPCSYQAKFAFSLNKTTLFLYDLTEIICSTCRPDFQKGQLLYTLKKK